MANGIIVTSLVVGGLAIGASAQVLTTTVSPTQTAAKTISAKTAVTAATTQPLLGVSSTWPLTTAVTAVEPAGVQTAAAVSTPATPVLTPLLPLNLTTMRLWNWGGNWIGSEWSNGNSPLPWKFGHINQPAGADTLFTLDATGAPEIQAGSAEAKTDGVWESEVTLPQLRDGLVVAPLWLYDSTSRDEIDFELAGRNGLDVTMHVYVNGVHKHNSVRLFAGTDLSGQRKRFGIKVDQHTGYVEMYVDGKRVQRWDKSTLGYFVSHPIKPWLEMWAANPSNSGFVQWVGKWTPLAAGQQLTMRVHGYGYKTLTGQIVI